MPSIRFPKTWFVVTLLLCGTAILGCAILPGCVDATRDEVVVYAALDKEFSEPLLKDFEKETGIRVLAKYDVESNKTVGLANEIIAQRSRQRCDLFWNNEILHTLRLKRAGLLVSYRSPEADKYPAEFVASDGTWHGFAARARVLIVNTERLPDRETWPTSVLDLANPDWKDNCGLARPLFGTTATHASVLIQTMGEERGRAFWKQVAANAVVEGGNKQVAVNVARGRYAFGLTDTDDAIIERERGAPVEIVFPDQGDDQFGTLLIPNTLAIVRGGPNPEQAKRLVDYLLRAETEARLASGPSAQIPLHADAPVRSRVEPSPPGKIKRMSVDFEAAADAWEDAARFLAETFPPGG